MTGPEIKVIYSDKDLIVINKPSGISAHGGAKVEGPTVVDFLLKHFPEIRGVGEDPIRPGIVHRLDKNTSGVMVVARNQDTFLALKELFQTRLVQKTYLAICCGKFKEEKGTISFPVGRLIANPLKRGADDGRAKIRGARDAHTDYAVLKNGEKFSLVKLKPKTGRMHQIRVHLSAIHHPVACDTIYGGKKVCCPAGSERQLLHASSISFEFPAGYRLEFEAEAPEDFTIAQAGIL